MRLLQAGHAKDVVGLDFSNQLLQRDASGKADACRCRGAELVTEWAIADQRERALSKP